MQIEFQNCSLKIGYIGTPDEILKATILDACQKAGDAVLDYLACLRAIVA
jgi:hypothetical protein